MCVCVCVCVCVHVPASPAVHKDGVVACLHLHSAHLVNEVNHAGTSLGRSSFWPCKEVELTDTPGLTGLQLWGGEREGRVDVRRVVWRMDRVREEVD